MGKKAAIVLGVFAGVVTGLIIKTQIDVLYLTSATNDILEYLEQESFDNKFLEIVEEEDWS